MAYGEFIESRLNKNAPLIFIIGGKDIGGEKPGNYMKSLGFDTLKDFNIYNINRTQDGKVSQAWDECKSILKSKGINPSKKILVGYSLGAEYLENIYPKENWDLVFSSGAAIPTYKGNYTSNKNLITSLTTKDKNGKPVSSKLVYVHSTRNDKRKNGDGQLLKVVKEYESLLPSANNVPHSGNHAGTVNATANWIKNNITVNKDGSAKIKIQTPASNTKANPDTSKKSEFGNILQGQLNNSLTTETQVPKSKGPVTSQSDKCDTNEKRPAVRKSNAAAANAGNIKKDAQPPTKNEKPQFSSNKYNHRYYILPITYTEKIKADTDSNSRLEDGLMGTSDRAQQQLEARLKTYSITGIGATPIIIKALPEEAQKIKSEKKFWMQRDNGPGVTLDINDISEIKSENIQKNQTVNFGFAGSTKKPEIKPKNTASERIVSHPDTLENMVKKSGPWYNRYWAYRLNSGPNYGYEKFETTISDKGIELISAVIPYWKPPKDEKNPDNEPKVKGDWKKLLNGIPVINSPIDVPIVLNSYQSGVMNNNIRYIYESENELHMTILESEIINKGKLAIGRGLNDSDALNKVPDSSWANYPRWSGIFAEHCLKNSAFTLQEKLGTNIDFYHRSIISRGRLVNHPGNEVMPWSKMKELGVKNRIFKPSKIWLDPKYSNSEEYLEEKEDSTIAIFIIGYHINRNGTLTDNGKKLVNHINNNLKWSMATISAVPHHASNSTLCYTDVLLYMDENGKIVTIGGNTDIPDGDFSIKSGNHIAVKVTNFAKFAKATANTYVNGSVIVAKVKSGPKPETYRESFGLANKLFTTPIFKKYVGVIEKSKTDKRLSEKINSSYYDKLLPYITNVNICSTANSAEREDDTKLDGETTEPEYISKDYINPLDMEEVSKENCKQLREKYNLKIPVCIPGVSAQATTKVMDSVEMNNCRGGLTPAQIANLMAAIAASESTSKYDIIGGSSNNYAGKYQFGRYTALKDTFTTSGSWKSKKVWNNQRMSKLKIGSLTQYLNCPIAQEIGMQQLIKLNYRYLQSGKNAISKEKINAMRCDELAGLLAISHLLGATRAQRYYKTDGKYEKSDGNGTKASDYFLLGANAVNGIFTHDKDKGINRRLQTICKGEKYFLYPGPLSNGLGLMESKSNTIPKQNTTTNSNINTAPQPVNDNIQISPGEYFIKINPAKVNIVTIPTSGPSELVGKKMYTPEEYLEAANAVNGINCSYFEDTLSASKNKFGVHYIPPFKNDAITDVERDGVPAYKRTPVSRDVGYYAYIDTNNYFKIATQKYLPVPNDSKYVFSVKVRATNASSQNIAPRGGDNRPWTIIGNMDDGNMFVYIFKPNDSKQYLTRYDAVKKLLKLPGIKDSAFLDSGGSTCLFYGGETIVKPGYKTFPNFLVWE
jgi:hypothetical protein